MSQLRVATIPDDHPYLAAVIPTDVTRVRCAADDADWAPSPLLDAGHRPKLLDGLDVIHVHFGYESLTATQLLAWTEAVRRSGVALVLTVHDLRNPHQSQPEQHDQLLAILLDAADVVCTLTPGAAAEINHRWQREAVVLAHPTLIPDAAVPEPITTQVPVVGLHLKSLRANVVDPIAVVRSVAGGVAVAGGTLRVDLHSEVADTAVGRGIIAAARAEHADVQVHARFSDDELLRYLASLSVSVLPYRFGTHSGWLELCRDLGVAAVVPDCGYLLDQWPTAHRYGNNERGGLDQASLTGAVEAAVHAGRPQPAARADRRRQRDDVRRAQSACYRRAVAAHTATRQARL